MTGSSKGRNFTQKFRNRKGILKIYIIIWGEDTRTERALVAKPSRIASLIAYTKMKYSERLLDVHNTPMPVSLPLIRTDHWAPIMRADWIDSSSMPFSFGSHKTERKTCHLLADSNKPTLLIPSSWSLKTFHEKVYGIVLKYPINDWWASTSVTLPSSWWGHPKYHFQLLPLQRSQIWPLPLIQLHIQVIIVCICA